MEQIKHSITNIGRAVKTGFSGTFVAKVEEEHIYIYIYIYSRQLEQ